MLFRKTPTSERDNYVYRFNDGTVSVIAEGCRTDFADIQNKKECGGNRQWQNHYLRNWVADTSDKAIT